MKKEHIFLKIITYAPLLFIPLIVGAITLFIVNSYNQNLQNSLKEIEEDLFKEEKLRLATSIENFSGVIVYNKSIIKKELTDRVKNRVDTAYNIARTIYEDNKDKKSEEEIKKFIKSALRPLVWNDGESFIWIVDFNGVFYLAPNYLKHLEGSSILNFQDATGRYVIKEEIAICKEKGQGFIWDTFTKPNEGIDKQYEQVAFVKSFGAYEWYLGSGEYLDTATKISDKRLLNTIKNIDTIYNDYVFIISTQGDILVNNSIPNSVGKNIFKSDNNLAKSVVNKIISSLKTKNSDFISYDWINNSTKEKEKKISYIKKIPGTDWIVGSGFYLSYISSKIDKQKVNMYDVMYSKSSNIVFIAIISIFVSLMFSFYITKKLKDSFNLYKDDIDEQKNKLLILNETLEDKVKKRTYDIEKLKNEYEKLATIDTLTGIDNRYSLMKRFSEEISRSNRFNTPLSLIIFDIDFFKKVNDTYGHNVGDTVLSSIANLVKNSLRDIDTIGRYGGEEFLILLPNTKLDDAEKIATKLLKKVEEHKFEPVDKITISIGLAEKKGNESWDDLFIRADELLYKSKTEGRNRVSI